MKRFFLFLLMATLFICHSLCIPPMAFTAERHPDPTKITFEIFKSPEGQFSVSVPSGWSRIESYPYKSDDTVNGIMLEGPENMDGAPIKIAVLHYAGAGWIKGAEHYIKMVLSNPTRLDAETETIFSDVTVAGAKGKTFTFKKFHLVILPFKAPPMDEGIVYEMNPPTRKVTMIVRHIVIPANQGFYSLWFEAPEDIYADFSTIFDRVVKSFSRSGK